MERIKDEFLAKLGTVVTLRGKDILEIGCGEGTRSVAIAKLCKRLVAVDPDPTLIKKATTENRADNVEYRVGSAEGLPFGEGEFDVVIFTLSFHHVPKEKMKTAIDEAVRVVKKGGFIVFLEPEFEGTLFESEIIFDAFDGDERKEKALAYFAMLDHPQLKEVAEIRDETLFKLESAQDFIDSMEPKGDISGLESFLTKNNFTLRASRRINVFQPRDLQ